MNKMRQQQANKGQQSSANEVENAARDERAESERRTSDDTAVPTDEGEETPQFERIKSQRSRALRPELSHEWSNPYDIDRVNTRESFVRTRSRSRP